MKEWAEMAYPIYFTVLLAIATGGDIVMARNAETGEVVGFGIVR